MTEQIHTTELLNTDSFLPVGSSALVRSFSAPAGKVYLLYGDPVIFRLSLILASRALSKGSTIAVVDGCNRFNVHTITRYARERKIDPAVLLKRIFISRGFTCYQMEAAVSSRLPAFLNSRDANIAMIFGLLDTFYDEQAPLQEVQQILHRLLHTFQTMKADGISLLLVCTEWNVLPKERNQLFERLKAGTDRVYRLKPNQENKPQIFLEQHRTMVEQKGECYGKNRPDLYQHYRKRAGVMVQIPAGAPEGRPDAFRRYVQHRQETLSRKLLRDADNTL